VQISSTIGAPPKTVVTAYLDGTADFIQPPVLSGHDQFSKAVEAPHLEASITGGRLSQSQEVKKGVAYLAGGGSVLALGAAAGCLISKEVGLLASLLSVPPVLMGARHLQTAFTERDFQPGSPEDGAQRLTKALKENEERHPAARKVAYLSGHGSHKRIAGFTPSDLGDILKKSPVDLTILDACTTAQLEVLSQLAPGAGLVLCSTLPVPGRGLPIEKMFEDSPNPALQAFQEAKDSTSNLSLIDSKIVEKSLLPALDDLGNALSQQMDGGNRDEVVKSVRKSRNPDLISPRVELGSFLSRLKESPLAPSMGKTIEKAEAAFKDSVVESTGLTFTFRLDGKENSELPPGWNRFVDKLDLKWKPILPAF